MSKFSRCLVAAASVAVGFSVYADGGWVFDSTAKTLTCGDNVIKNVTVKNATSKTLAIGDNKSNANIVQLDLTLPIADGDGVAYTINPEQGSIGTWQGNKTLQMLKLPQPGCNSIQWDMFKNCTALTSVEIVEGTTTIGANSFNGCTSLSSLTIPSTITSIGSAAFQSTAIKSFVVPGSMETVNAGFVPGCAKLESFIVSEGVKSFGAGNFFSKTTSLKYVEFPSTLEQVTGTDWFDYAYNKCDVVWPVFPKKGFAAKNCPYGGHDNNNTKTNYIHWSSRQDWIDYSATNAFGIVFNMPATYDGLGSWVGSHTHVIKYYVPEGGVVPWEVSLVKEQSGDYTVGVTVANVAGKVYAKATCEGESDVIVQISDSLGVGGTATATLSASSLTPEKSYAVTVYGESADGEVVLGNFAGYAGSSAPTDKNYWTNASGDGLASTAANWSRGTPVVGDDIVIDGKWCNADLTWDLPSVATVASWEQTAEYTGTVTMPTTFPNYANSAFKTFTVTGVMTIDGGTLTHPLSVDLPNDGTKYTIDQLRSKYVYRLCLSVGGLAIGGGGKIDAKGKGHRQSPTTSAGRCPGYVSAHGGRQDSSSFACYGNVKYPEDIGTAAGAGTDGSGSKHAPGGGAVKITSSGACVVNGEISVDGAAASGKLTASAAGSILIEAPSVSGVGSIHADGCYTGNNSYRNGAGGRVAILTTTPVDTDILTVSAGSSGSGKYGAEGTVYLKDSTMTYGVLYMNNPLYASSNSTPGMGAYVTNENGVDWRFDGIKLNGHVNLYVPADTTLTLPNGFASVTAPRNTARVSGIYYRGGTIDVGSGDQTIGNGYWYFFPSSNFVFSANLTVGGNAAIGGCSYWEQSIANNAAPTSAWKTLFEVVGDMTVSTDGVVTADAMGLGQQSGTQYEGVAIGAHGGRRSATGATMDSVFEPHVCGVYQSNSYGYVKAGGLIDFSVGGCLTVDGNIHADSPDTSDGGRGNAAGGAINILAGSIAGSGTISASAKRDVQCGGRIAIKLTESDATFDDFTGSIYVNGGGNASGSSAGSIYLQGGAVADKCGVMTIDNKNKDGLFTPICATGYDADAVDDFKKANLVLSNKGKAQVAVADNGQFKMASIDIDATSKLDLFGNTLTVQSAKLGDTTLAAGTYAASDYSAYLTDSVGGGSLVVMGSARRGLTILFR